MPTMQHCMSENSFQEYFLIEKFLASILKRIFIFYAGDGESRER